MNNNRNIELYEAEVNKMLALMLKKHATKNSTIRASMIYSLMGGGKRIRPMLFMSLLEAFGIDYKKYHKVICAIEMIHTYSLVHDDLPGMDNDSMRRGRQTTHIKFDEATAILCGDSLLTDAFYLISSLDLEKGLSVQADLVLQLIRVLSLAAGSKGMIYGQYLDLNPVPNSKLKDVESTYYYKTCQLIQSSIVMAALVAGKDIKDINDFVSLGTNLGQAFQIQDDVLDSTKTSEQLGKDANSDQKNDKTTAVSLLGLEKAQLLAEDYFDKVDTLLEKLGLTGTKFHLLIIEIANRQM